MIPGDIVKEKEGDILYEVLEVLKDKQPVGIRVRPLDNPKKGTVQVLGLPSLVVVDPLDALGEQSDAW